MKQLEMEFLWPHNVIQLSLDLEEPEQPIKPHTYVDTGTSWGPIDFSTLGTTAISPTLSVSPTNSVGELSIGGVNIGIEKKPSALQRILYKLLGFKWSEK